jgi:hypothetical protein
MVDSSIGSLVGVNNGFITNSRVINGLPLHAYGNVGGLVAVNDGVISASYFNGKITNYSIVAEASSTGGLVAVNSGRINSSYTEGKYIPCEGLKTWIVTGNRLELCSFVKGNCRKMDQTLL